MVAGYRNLMMIANEILYENFFGAYSSKSSGGYPFISYDEIGEILKFETELVEENV